jgi:hypothetical protein
MLRGEQQQKEGSRPGGGYGCRKKNVPPYRCQPVLMIGVRGADKGYAWSKDTEIAVFLFVRLLGKETYQWPYQISKLRI